MNKSGLFWILFTILIVAIGAVLALFILTRTSVPFTELYFYEPESLPSELRLDQEGSFTFVVINHENKPMEYEYTVVQESHIGTQTSEEILSSASFSLESGDYETFSLNFELAESIEKSQVIVSVADQEIYFWVNSSEQ